MKILIGNTGLVGGVLKEKINFDLEFNSSNIENYHNFNINNSELYLACLPATKWLVNRNILADLENINKIFNIIKRYSYNKIVLISTIDVYNGSPIHSDEHTVPIIKKLDYGSNRYLFELMIQELNCSNIQIYRLPALFSNKIKKNVLYDLLHNNNINSINVNSYYQWFNLNNLVHLIESIDLHGTFNLFTEPLHTSKLFELFNVNVETSNLGPIIEYDYKTKLSNSGYIETSNTVLLEIKKLIDEVSSKPFNI